MNYLIDTHIFLWAITNSPKLSAKVRTALVSPDSIVFVSAVTPWEISIKRSLGKLKTPEILYEQEFEANRLAFLNINLNHTLAVEHLPYHHKDPFDRLLIAQAKVEKITLISNDARIQAYDVKVIG